MLKESHEERIESISRPLALSAILTTESHEERIEREDEITCDYVAPVPPESHEERIES